jgi:hypothetical protein
MTTRDTTATSTSRIPTEDETGGPRVGLPVRPGVAFTSDPGGDGNNDISRCA